MGINCSLKELFKFIKTIYISDYLKGKIELQTIDIFNELFFNTIKTSAAWRPETPALPSHEPTRTPFGK
jgi:hypothetical protein